MFLFLFCPNLTKSRITWEEEDVNWGISSIRLACTWRWSIVLIHDWSGKAQSTMARAVPGQAGGHGGCGKELAEWATENKPVCCVLPWSLLQVLPWDPALASQWWSVKCKMRDSLSFSEFYHSKREQNRENTIISLKLLHLKAPATWCRRQLLWVK